MKDSQPSPSGIDYLKALPQYLLPGHLISRLTLGFTRIRAPWVKNPFGHWFAKQFKLNLDEAVIDRVESYDHFNALFTRALKEGARPVDADEKAVVSPVDGTISQFGPIEEGRIFQAKGRDYSLLELLGGSEGRAEPFEGGSFMTIYLSPSDYHRIHMPLAGKLTEMVHVPGRLFSVNPATTRVIPRLFARNERVVSIFDTGDDGRPLALVKVGAINVGSIETVWAGEVTPPAGRVVRRWQYDGEPALSKGEEMGRFNMGSTVILVFPRGMLSFEESLAPGMKLRLGQRIATLD